MGLDNYDYTPNRETVTKRMPMPEGMNHSEYEKVQFHSDKKSIIATIITISSLALILFAILFSAFGINPVTKLKFQMLFNNNYQISIEGEYIFKSFSNGSYIEIPQHATIAKITFDDNFFQIKTKVSNSKYAYNYYEIDGDILYQYVYNGNAWEKIEYNDENVPESDGVDVGDDLAEIILNPNNFEKAKGELNVWQIKSGVSEKYPNLQVQKHQKKYVYSWTEKDTTYYIIFDSFGQTELNIPWD